jgi:hypothetical protein
MLISRRRLLISMAGAPLLAPVAAKGLATPPPFISPATARASRYIPQSVSIPIGNTTMAVPDNSFNDTTSNSLNSRRLCWVPTASDVTDIVLAFPGFGLNAPEADLPGGYTVVAASIEYPLGTPPSQVFFSGAASMTVTPGRVLIKSDPLPITIPAGSSFAVKCDLSWTPGNFWLNDLVACFMLGEWTARGTNLGSHSLDNTTVTSSSTTFGFAPVCYATPASPIACVGLIGDSIGQLAATWIDPNTGSNTWGQPMRGVLPFINLARSSDYSVSYFARHEGRNLVLRNGITHLIWEMGGNDLFDAVPLATMQTNLLTAIEPFIDRGVQCFAVTLTPRTSSTDGWISAANQTLVSTSNEATRQSYNAWLRSNWSRVGLAGFFDLAHAVDPGDTGKWSFDAGTTVAGAANAAGFPTLTSGVVTGINLASYAGTGSSTINFPPGGANVPLVIYPYPGTGGSGAAGVAVPDSTNPWINHFNVTSGGSGYTVPPLCCTSGPFTSDGAHPIYRGWIEAIYQMGIGPQSFQL